MIPILRQDEMDFKSLERNIFEYGCKAAREELRQMLQAIDRHLMKTRDRTIYRHKGYRKTCIKTLMGEVEYSRAVYELMDESAERKFIYLLDEYMGFDCVGFVSSNLAEKIADTICECSYAQTAKSITDLTGQRISHQGVWNVVQRLGEKIEEQENEYIARSKDTDFRGERKTEVLLEEADGVIVRKQKRCKGKGKNFEIKVAVFHEGWKQTGKNRFELAEKNVVCGIESGRTFAKRKEAMIAKIYDTNEIKMRIFNSDGGAWIKALYEKDDNVYHQRNCEAAERCSGLQRKLPLDPFHVKKAVKRTGLGKEFENYVFHYLKTAQPEQALDYIETVMEHMEDSKKRKRIFELYQYLSNNKNSLVPYQNRGIRLPDLKEGLVYRSMGNAEHNVYLTVARRMKHRSAAWSEHGGLMLCKLICLKVSHKLEETLETLSEIVLSERFTERTEDILSASKIAEKTGKGYRGRVCGMPYKGTAMTQTRKEMMRWLEGSEAF